MGIRCFTVLTTVFYQNVFVKSLGKGKDDRNPKELFIDLSLSLEVLVPLRSYFSLSFREILQHTTQKVLQGLLYDSMSGEV